MTETGESPPEVILLSAGRFDLHQGYSADRLAAIFDRAIESRSRLVIYFHGGLVDRKDGTSAAASLAPRFREAGAFPLFVVWETGWRDVLYNKLPKILKEPIFEAVLLRVTQFVQSKADKASGDAVSKSVAGLRVLPEEEIGDLLRNARAGQDFLDGSAIAAAASPDRPPENQLSQAETEAIEAELEADPQLRALLRNTAATRQALPTGAKGAVAVPDPNETLITPEVLDDIATPPAEGAPKGVISTVKLAKHIAFIVGHVLWRFGKERDHGPYLTLVEEVLREFYIQHAGKFFWDGMKQQIEESFGDDPKTWGGTALIEHLRKTWSQPDPPELVLVGHSAGGIYVSRLLEEIERRGLPAALTARVILIAPACTFTMLTRSLQKAGARVSGLRVFGMGDANERKDWIATVLYPASLLYFVSGVIEDERDAPLVGMERYYREPYKGGTFPDIDWIKSFACFTQDRSCVWSDRTDEPGFRCDMRSHGGWVEAPMTLDSVLHILKSEDGNG